MRGNGKGSKRKEMGRESKPAKICELSRVLQVKFNVVCMILVPYNQGLLSSAVRVRSAVRLLEVGERR